MACLIEGWKWKTRDSNEIEHSIEKNSNTNQNSNDCYCDDHNHYGGLLGPVLEIDFGPPTARSKNLKICVNFDLFRSPALWSSENVSGPHTMVAAIVGFKDQVWSG